MTAYYLASPISDSMARVCDIRLEYSVQVICHGPDKTAQRVGIAKIAAEVREEEGAEDIGRCCRGGDSEQRYRFAGAL